MPVESGPALLTNNGRAFWQNLGGVPEAAGDEAHHGFIFDPQTNGKLERYHRIAKASVNLFIYHSPEALSDAIDSFVDHYNYRRYTRPWEM